MFINSERKRKFVANDLIAFLIYFILTALSICLEVFVNSYVFSKYLFMTVSVVFVLAIIIIHQQAYLVLDRFYIILLIPIAIAIGIGAVIVMGVNFKFLIGGSL